METDTKSLFQITEAAHACGVSRSTLMRMEEKGLLAPAYVAPESGRRYYDNHNVARVLQIEKFKSMGLGAQEIADYFVRGGEVSGLLAVLEERLQELLPKSLYSVHIKEDMSAKNYPSNPNWYKEFAEMKTIVNKKLDRTFWSKYLDFAVIDQWMQKGKPSEEERDHDSFVLMNLFYCVMTQNLIEKTSEKF